MVFATIRNRKAIYYCALVAVTLWGLSTLFPDSARADEENLPIIQVALLLDTGDSTSGLIEQAQSQIWHLLNELNSYRLYGKSPELQVALYEFGNAAPGAGSNYLQLILPFTINIDLVAESLFSLTPDEAPKYCGAVIQNAVDNLAWSQASDSIKLIFIAGNGSFSLGPINYRAACRAAADQGIIVSLLYCGDPAEDNAANWLEASLTSGLTFLSIDLDFVPDTLEAPQDKRINELAANLNQTYIPFGPAGAPGQNNQSNQDDNASFADVIILRSLAKATAQYRNPGWDLVDAVAEGAVQIESLDLPDLPDNIQKMTPHQRDAYVNAIGRQRHAFQRQIKQLSLQRKRFLSDSGIETDPAQSDSFAGSVIEIIREIAGRKNYIIDASEH